MDASSIEQGTTVYIKSDVLDKTLKITKKGDNYWENEDGFPFVDEDIQIDADEGAVVGARPARITMRGVSAGRPPSRVRRSASASSTGGA